MNKLDNLKLSKNYGTLIFVMYVLFFIFLTFFTYGGDSTNLDYKKFTSENACNHTLYQINFYDFEETGKEFEVTKKYLNFLRNFEDLNCLSKVVQITDGWPEIRVIIGDDNLFFQTIKFLGFSSLFLFLFSRKKNYRFASAISFLIFDIIVTFLFSSDFRNPEFPNFYSYEFLFLEVLVVYFLYLYLKTPKSLDQTLKTLSNIFTRDINKFLIYFIAFFITLRSLWKFNIDKYKPHIIHEYIINYDFGFIRRGLLGSIFNLFTSDILFIGLVIVPIIIVLVHFIYTFLLLKIYDLSKKSIYDLFIIASPSLLAFQIYLSGGAPGNKEIYGLVGVLLVLLSKKIDYSWILFLGVILFNLSIYIHEINLFFLVTFLYICRRNKTFIYTVIFTGINVIFFLFNYFNIKNLKFMTDQLCSEYFTKFHQLKGYVGCGKSDFLRQDIFTSIEISSNRIYEDNQYLIVYGTYLLLALIPYFFNQHVELEKYKIFFVIIQVLPLFIVAYDWGRWIFIISNLLFIFYYESDIKPNNSYLPVFSGVSFIALMMYVILWRIPYCCVEDLNIINLFRVNKLNFSFFIPLFLYFYLQIKNKKDNIQIKNN